MLHVLCDKGRPRIFGEENVQLRHTRHVGTGGPIQMNFHRCAMHLYCPVLVRNPPISSSFFDRLLLPEGTRRYHLNKHCDATHLQDKTLIVVVGVMDTCGSVIHTTITVAQLKRNNPNWKLQNDKSKTTHVLRTYDRTQDGNRPENAGNNENLLHGLLEDSLLHVALPCGLKE